MNHILIAILITVLIVAALVVSLQRAGLFAPTGATDKWWTWRWDTIEGANLNCEYTYIVRWRRGWLTLYKFVSVEGTDWRLFLPFNINVGISLENKL